MQLAFYNGAVMDRQSIAIERIKTFEPKAGYYLAFSGGKDSIVCYDLLVQAGAKFDAHYHLTTVDPPELVHFIKDEYPNVIIDKPKKTMWELIKLKGFPPSRQVRYCCQLLKERGGEGRFVVTGVRWAESPKRKNTRQIVEFDSYGSKSKHAIEQRRIFLNSDNDGQRTMIEVCQVKGKHILNPIIDWADIEIWGYIKEQKLKYPSLYDEGFKRLGCIGCPLAGKKQVEQEFERWPKYRAAYLRSFNYIINEHHKHGRYLRFTNGEDALEYWIDHGHLTTKYVEED